MGGEQDENSLRGASSQEASTDKNTTPVVAVDGVGKVYDGLLEVNGDEWGERSTEFHVPITYLGVA
jgi:hypothetical protein